MAEGQAIDDIPLGVWDPERYLAAVSMLEARLSRGFMRCRAERWVPGFAAQWLPLVHTLGIDIRFIEAIPVVPTAAPEELDQFDQPTLVDPLDRVVFPSDLPYCYVASVDEEAISIQFSQENANLIADSVVPTLSAFESRLAAKRSVLEYLARRLVASLALAWSGPQISVVRYEPELGAADVAASGVFKLNLSINGQPCSIWITVGAVLANKLDGLWRRQLLSTNRGLEKPTDIGVEIAQLAVPPAMLAEYTRSGTIVDLEVAISDRGVLRQGGKPWLPVRFVNIQGQFGFQTIPGPVPTAALPEGTTRLSLQLGTVVFDGPTLYEMTQTGAIFESEIELGDQVQLVINGEKVGDATLCTYEGRFAISVS